MTTVLYFQPVFDEHARRAVDSVSRNLEEHGYTVSHVETIEEALGCSADVILAGVIFDGDCPEIRQYGSRSAANLTAYERLQQTGTKVVVMAFYQMEIELYKARGFPTADYREAEQVHSLLGTN